MRAGRLLIVDSDVNAREGLTRILGQEGFVVDCVGRGVDAVEALRNCRFACVIVDVDLADMKAWDAVRVMRAVAPRLDVIVTAAQNTAEIERRVREANISYYHIKSFDPGELVQATVRLCGRPSKGGGRDAVESDKTKVLIVDDEPEFHEALRGILEVSGFEVVSAFSKADGMQKVRREMPDVIILDVIMETMTAGFHFASEIRQDPELKHIPILSVSGVSEKTGLNFNLLTDQEFFPVDDFVAKPVRAKDLIARLKLLVGKRSKG